MLTPKQQEWVDHLSDTDTIKIFPFDADTPRKFEKLKEQIQAVFGSDIEVLHRGATGLGISGQAEIDVYIPVDNEKIEPMAAELEKAFEKKPKSIYPGERTKFLQYIDGTKVEVMLVNRTCQSWIDGERFFNYLIMHPDTLELYRKLKENGNNLTVREYYKRKIEFINEILSHS